MTGEHGLWLAALVAAGLGLGWLAAGIRRRRARPRTVSDHFDGRRFFNPTGRVERSFGELMQWRMEGGAATWPDWLENPPPAPPPSPTGEDVHITFVNHSTFLIQTPAGNLLTDPIWSERCSPVGFAGPRRVRAPGVDFEHLPRIDVVLVSHNHYDHLDVPTLRRLRATHDPTVVTLLGNAAALRRLGFQRVHELDWWEAQGMGGRWKVTATPAQHFSARGFHDRNRSLWGGFWIEVSGRKLYFAGDSGYCRWFAEIRQRLGVADVALLPIGAYEPRWFMKPAHMNPEEAVKAHLDLGAVRSAAMHFGTFQLTNEGIDEPTDGLRRELLGRGLPDEVFRVPRFGETWSVGAG
jgi:L-ascorbate metabolism protein UlaG (beta-lactamase superfamily)